MSRKGVALVVVFGLGGWYFFFGRHDRIIGLITADGIVTPVAKWNDNAWISADEQTDLYVGNNVIIYPRAINAEISTIENKPDDPDYGYKLVIPTHKPVGNRAHLVSWSIAEATSATVPHPDLTYPEPIFERREYVRKLAGARTGKTYSVVELTSLIVDTFTEFGHSSTIATYYTTDTEGSGYSIVLAFNSRSGAPELVWDSPTSALLVGSIRVPGTTPGFLLIDGDINRGPYYRFFALVGYRFANVASGDRISGC